MRSSVGLADLARLLRVLPFDERPDAAALVGGRRIPRALVVAAVEPGESEGEGFRLNGAIVAHDATPARHEYLLGDTHAADVTTSAAAPASLPRPPRTRNDTIPIITPVPLVTRSVEDQPPGRAGYFRIEAAAERELQPRAAPVPFPQGLTDDDLKSKELSALPASSPLAAWSTLLSRLHAAIHVLKPTRDPDAAALVRAWARGECLRRIPRRERRVWTASATLWIDRSSRLTPFWDDQEMVYRQLVRLCGNIELKVLDANQQASLVASHGDLIGPRPPDPAVPVLVLGDLGFYGTELDRGLWLRTARQLRRSGVRVAALVPCPTSRWDHELARAWNATAWERASTVDDRGTAEARAEALLRLVSPTALAQPGLLRALRRLLPAADADASTEVDVWRHTDVLVADVNGLVLEREASARWRTRFATEVPAAMQVEVCDVIEHWHGHWRSELIHAETLTWLAHGLAGELGRPNEARAFIKRLEATLCWLDTTDEDVAVVKHYGRHLLGAFPEQGFRTFPELKNVWTVVFDDVADARLPSTIEPQELFVRTSRRPQRWNAYQRGEALVLLAETTGAALERESGSLVATLTAAAREVWVQRGNDSHATRTRLTSGTSLMLRPGERIRLRTDCSDIVLDIWERASWASAAGRDRYGLWAAFEVREVQQRMRWIPPGQFLMGSSTQGPPNNEGPQHRVTIQRGYWLGETPVTQALWCAIMPTNPSRFPGERRPVEGVSWTDCQIFIERLNRMLEGLSVRLPDEAEWERACRGGNVTSAEIGDLATVWYRGNSTESHLFDGNDHGLSTSLEGTHPVGLLKANSYGLYDMLGNVYEWCQDRARGWETPFPYPYKTEHVPGYHLPQESRVIRGGSWFSEAREVRATHRTANTVDNRRSTVGFRLAARRVAS